VDVDSQYLVCRIQRGDKKFSLATFDNNPLGHRQFIRWCTKHHKTARVTMEATGVYSLPFALALHQCDKIEVSVVNPRAIKNFAMAQVQRGKTDALDADAILEYTLRMDFKKWQPPREEVLELQHITRRIVQLTAELTRERNRHIAASRLGIIGRVVAHDTDLNMRHIQRRIDAMAQAALDIVEHDAELQPKLKQLITITGIASKTGPRILAELAGLPDDMTSSQWVAHAGLDPKPHESGKTTHKPRRISKAGNRYLREALYFPALVASRSDPNVKAFYEKLVNKGKKPMQALVAIMRKLLLAIWGMFKHDTTWDGEKFFKLA
ncbi:IS110 family transposase, partial [endosymbiont of Lamellibrachia barhami]|uniref:IS110 family transposase n=1 Tax=endosymbiont of Lamellibrachia barhami TaxID=205975 RepID=UPI001C4C08F8